MKQAEAVERAAAILNAKRFGLEHPDDTYATMDAVLIELTPKYNQDPTETERWHQLAREVDALASRTASTKKYRQRVNHARTRRRCGHCTTRIERHVGESKGQWAVRRYCSPECERAHAGGKR